MSQKQGGENPITRIWRDLKNTWSRYGKESTAIGHGGTTLRVAFLAVFLILLFICLLLFGAGLLSLNIRVLENVQSVRLTIYPYTPTATVTPTKKPTNTITPTVTLTPTGKLPTATITPTFLTPTFTVTSTPTLPVIPLRTLYPDNYYILEKRLINPWTWRHIFALVFGVTLAGWLVVLYIRDLYGIRGSVRAAGLFVRMLLLMPIGTIRVKGGNLVDNKGQIVRKDWILVTPQGKIVRKNDSPVRAKSIRRTLRLLRVGIPARLIVEEDSCVVIEGSQKQSLVIGPTGKPVILLGFSHIRKMVDLRDAEIKLSLRQPTSNGVPLTAEDVQFIFSVTREDPIKPGAAYPYNEQAIFNLVYRYWLDGEWLPEMKARITAELRQFIMVRPLSTFLPFISQNQGTTLIFNQTANPFNVFVSEFNSQAIERGIQIQWHGEGIWKLPSDADLAEQLENWQKNVESLLKLPEQFPDEPSRGEYNQALIEIIRQVPLSLLEPLSTSNEISRRTLLIVIEKYRDKLNEALQLYQQRGQTPPEELVEVIEHLNRLILRRV